MLELERMGILDASELFITNVMLKSIVERQSSLQADRCPVVCVALCYEFYKRIRFWLC